MSSVVNMATFLTLKILISFKIKKVDLKWAFIINAGPCASRHFEKPGFQEMINGIHSTFNLIECTNTFDSITTQIHIYFYCFM